MNLKTNGSVCFKAMKNLERTTMKSVFKFISCPSITYRGALWSTYELILVLLILVYPCTAHTWERPGCHVVGYRHEVEIDGCIKFSVETNACRGYCASEATPSDTSTRNTNPQHLITSRAECCSIKDAVDKIIKVNCGADGFKHVAIKSASNCSCSVCR
ncbi:G protein alpha-like subunit [Mactra antiquata]